MIGLGTTIGLDKNKTDFLLWLPVLSLIQASHYLLKLGKHMDAFQVGRPDRWGPTMVFRNTAVQRKTIKNEVKESLMGEFVPTRSLKL